MIHIALITEQNALVLRWLVSNKMGKTYFNYNNKNKLQVLKGPYFMSLC